MPSQLRTAVAAAVAPMVGGLAIMPIIGGGCGCAIPIALAINVIVGVPVSLRFFGPRTRWWQVALAGLVAGALPFVLLSGYWAIADWRYHTDLRWQMRALAGGAVCGAVTALVFWWIAGREFLASDDERTETR